MGRYVLCPYFLSEHNRTISCEDCMRWYSSADAQNKWLDKYCEDNWASCPYAKELARMYDRIENSHPSVRTEIVLRQETDSLRRELRKVRIMLGKAEKKIERLENGNKNRGPVSGDAGKGEGEVWNREKEKE